MNNHLSLRSGNPVLSNKIFASAGTSSNSMTISGTVNKTFFCLLLLVVTGCFTFKPISPFLLIGCAIGGLIFALITIFKKTWAPVTVPIYALLRRWISRRYFLFL